MSGVSRFKICTFELGSGALNQDELERIKSALVAEADRLRSISTQIDIGLARQPKASNGAPCVGNTKKSR
jgi:hypothetical protein